MENTTILKDWVWVSLTRRKPETSQLLSTRFSSFFWVSHLTFLKVGLFFWVAYYKRSGSLDFGTPTFEFWDCTWQAGQVFANSKLFFFFFCGKLHFKPIFYIGFKLQSSYRYWKIYRMFHIWDGLMLLNWTTTRQKHKVGCKKINDTFKADIFFFFESLSSFTISFQTFDLLNYPPNLRELAQYSPFRPNWDYLGQKGIVTITESHAKHVIRGPTTAIKLPSLLQFVI